MNQESRNMLKISGVFAVLCLILCVILWMNVKRLTPLRDEYDMSELERENLESEIDSLTAIESNLEKFRAINLDSLKPASDIVEFYSQIRRAAENNGMNIITTSQNGKTVTLTLRGGYYSFVNLLADWRVIPSAGKISRLRIYRDREAPALFILADVTLTAY